jgi:hypothetical protein
MRPVGSRTDRWVVEDAVVDGAALEVTDPVGGDASRVADLPLEASCLHDVTLTLIGKCIEIAVSK